MGLPAAFIASAARSRRVWKIAAALSIALSLTAALIVGPLLAIPLIAASQTVAGSSGLTPMVKGDWGYPMAGDYFKGRGFGFDFGILEICSYCRTHHDGYDMAQGCGSPIYAAGPGRVLSAGALSTWGNTVRIDHGDGLVSLYGHMQWGSLRVAPGQEVTAGTPLGAEGTTGRSFGCHLHFEIQQDGAPIPPEPFMAALGLPLK